MKKPSIHTRIQGALQTHGGRLEYAELATLVFPPDQYPRSWAYSINGGPPFCYRTLSREIKLLGYDDYTDEYRKRWIRSKDKGQAK